MYCYVQYPELSFLILQTLNCLADYVALQVFITLAFLFILSCVRWSWLLLVM